jgi:tetratricopeptide (TPR) repeat protein
VSPKPSAAEFAAPGSDLAAEAFRPVVQTETALPSEPERVDLSWLEEEDTAGPVAEQASVDVFEAEEEFFDLASELERELGGEEGLIDSKIGLAPEEQSLEDIVEGFRQGMAETLSAEDYDTHYNLGIAYREMGLVDEAISEFQLAAKDSRYLVDCCSLLATCFTEKGFPELAVKWYEEGLKSPSITQDEELGLVYELGDLYLSLGKPEQARRRFVQIYDVNSSYRDVVSKLSELDGA